MQNRASAIALVVAVLGQAGSAVAAPGPDIGNAVLVSKTVTAAFETDKRKLGIGDDVRQDELIEVSADGRGELKFKDDTKLALGPGARLVLDKFVYDPAETNGSIVMNLAKGAFRFITGVAAKPNYQIKTPTASISVRGTIFDADVRPDGSTWLLLIEGAIEVCNRKGDCRVLDQPGMVMRVDPEGKVAPPSRWTKVPGIKKVNFDDRFPFVDAPPSFDAKPILTKRTILWGVLPLITPHGRPHDRGDRGGPPNGDGPKGGTKTGGTTTGGTRTGDGGTGTTTTPPQRGKGGKKVVTHTPPIQIKKAQVTLPLRLPHKPKHVEVTPRTKYVTTAKPMHLKPPASVPRSKY